MVAGCFNFYSYTSDYIDPTNENYATELCVKTMTIDVKCLPAGSNCKEHPSKLGELLSVKKDEKELPYSFYGPEWQEKQVKVSYA